MTPPASPPAPAPGRAPELAEVIRRFGPLMPELSCEQRRVLDDLAACRTAALGGHMETCDRCGHRRPAYNSCRNRHCPKCQGPACADWMEAQAADLLPVQYFHVVFTLPDAFNALALGNRRVVYGALFKAASRTLLEVAADPKHLGARIGFLAVLHTWGQNLSLHPHLHCIVPGGGLSADGGSWVGCRPGFFLPVRVLSRVFRGKFIALLRDAFRAGTLRGVSGEPALEALLDSAAARDWVVYAKPPFGGPDQVLKYLARYAHRVAISNRRILGMDERAVTFRYKDYARGDAHGGRAREMTLGGTEFLRRFLLHVVPAGFMRVRHFGFLANRFRAANLQRCRELLGTVPAGEGPAQAPDAPDAPDARPTGGAGDHRGLCPACGRGRMTRGEELRPLRPRPNRLPLSPPNPFNDFNDSS